MGHTKSIGAVSANRKSSPMEIAREVAAWTLAEHQAWREAIPGSRRLADAVADGVVSRMGAATWTVTQLTALAGCHADTIRRGLLGEQREHGMLGIPGLELVVRGRKGRGRETEVRAHPLTPLPAILEIQNDSDINGSENQNDSDFHPPEKPRDSVYRLENQKSADLLSTSTGSLENPSDSLSNQPSPQPPTDGGRAGLTGPQEALLGALLDLDCPPDLAEQAARVCPTTRRPERLGLLLPALEPLLAMIAKDPRVQSPHHVLAKRLRNGEAYGQALALQGRVRDLQPEAGNALGLGATPSPRPSPLPLSAEAMGAPSDAVAAYARLAEEVERLDPEVATSWYRPAALQQGVLTLDHAWFSAEHEDVFQRAATSLGLRIAVPGEPATKKIG